MSLPASTRATPRSNRLRGSSTSSPKFPFAENAFASARLSAEQLHAHQRQIHQLIARALDECDRADTSGRAAYSNAWETVGMQDNVTALWRPELPTSNTPTTTSHTSHTSQYRLIGDVVGDYRDHMALYYADTSNDLFEWLQFMYQSTLDAHVIQTVESQSPSQPHLYFGVKWAVFQLSKFATKVDQCFVEYMTYCKDRRGREVGVRVTLPIRIPEIDLTMDALKVRRMASTMVQILRPVNDKTTRMFALIENDFLPASPTAYVKTLLTLSQHAKLAIDARRIRRHGLMAPRHWIPNASRRSCVVCTRAFSAARGRHHCRLCGDVICRKCIVHRDTADTGTAKTFKVVKTKFCLLCVVHMQDRKADTDGHAVTAVDRSTWSSSKGSEVEDVVSDPVDEGAKSSMWSETDSESYNEVVLFVPDESIETIDTKDMLRGHSLGSEGASPLDVSGLSALDEFKKRRSRTDSTNLLGSSTSRSLDQNLAEQEALLRQMFSASTTTAQRNGVTRHSGA